METFKLKGNKRFRTWTKKSLLVFRISGFLCSMYICSDHSMYVSHIRIWLWYMCMAPRIYCVFVRKRNCSYQCMCMYFRSFCFSIITILPINNIYLMCYKIQPILFNILYLHTVKLFQVLLCNTNYSIIMLSVKPAGGRVIGFIPFPRVLVLCEMQSVSSRFWTRLAVSISYDDNHYTTGTSLFPCLDRIWQKVNF